MDIKKTPLWQLTVGEFIDLLQAHSMSYATLQSTPVLQQAERSYVYGISGLARLLNCSKVTAQKVKNSGEIDACYSQAGRKLVFDTEKVLATLKKKNDGE